MHGSVILYWFLLLHGFYGNDKHVRFSTFVCFVDQVIPRVRKALKIQFNFLAFLCWDDIFINELASALDNVIHLFILGRFSFVKVLKRKKGVEAVERCHVFE